MASLCSTRTGMALQRPQQRVSRVAHPRAMPSTRSRALTVAPRAEGRNGSSGDFMTGFVMGGVVFGALGFLFAPQISKALLGDDHRLRLPRFLEEEGPKDPEQTKQELIDKIAQLNASIDEVASQLKPKDEAIEAEVRSS